MVVFGITIPNRMPLISNSTSTHVLLELAERVDGLAKFDSAWVGDNLLTKPRLESISILSSIAVKTSRINLGTACMASFPLRDPILLAIQWATLDIISSGRTILGVCIGGAEAGGEITPDKEFATFGRSVRDRVAIMAEGIELLRKIWTEDRVSFSGRFYNVEDVVVIPKPIQRPPPIWIAVTPKLGHRERAYRRVARLADGWITTKVTPEEFSEGWKRIREYAEEYGRRVEENVLYYNLNVNVDREEAFREAKKFLDAYYMMDFSRAGIDIWTAYGSPDDCIKKLDEYASAGVKRITIRFASTNQISQLERFVNDVLPSF